MICPLSLYFVSSKNNIVIHSSEMCVVVTVYQTCVGLSDDLLIVLWTVSLL